MRPSPTSAGVCSPMQRTLTALTWLGSGALAAFDGLNQLLLMSGLGGPDAHWTLIDMVVVIKVMIGLLAGAVGVLAVATAARDSTRDQQLLGPASRSDAETMTTRPAA